MDRANRRSHSGILQSAEPAMGRGGIILLEPHSQREDEEQIDHPVDDEGYTRQGPACFRYQQVYGGFQRTAADFVGAEMQHFRQSAQQRVGSVSRETIGAAEEYRRCARRGRWQVFCLAGCKVADYLPNVEAGRVRMIAELMPRAMGKDHHVTGIEGGRLGIAVQSYPASSGGNYMKTRATIRSTKPQPPWRAQRDAVGKRASEMHGSQHLGEDIDARIETFKHVIERFTHSNARQASVAKEQNQRSDRNPMPPTILVLGATGKTGRRLVPLLEARGAMVRAGSRRPDSSHILFDWHQPGTYDAALRGVDAVYLIGPDMVADPRPQVGAFLDVARTHGVRRIVLLSSMGVDFPNEGRGTGRYDLEQQVMASGFEWTLLRPCGFSQNFSEGFLLPGILEADMIATATGDGAVAFVDAEDIAAVAATTLTEDGHSGAAYVITGPEPLTFEDAAAVISDVSDRTITHRKIASEDFTQILLTAGMPADYAALIVGNQEAIREGLGADVTDVVAAVGGRAARTFADYAAGAAPTWRRS